MSKQCNIGAFLSVNIYVDCVGFLRIQAAFLDCVVMGAAMYSSQRPTDDSASRAINSTQLHLHEPSTAKTFHHVIRVKLGCRNRPIANGTSDN
jgi:hypothetical protein